MLKSCLDEWYPLPLKEYSDLKSTFANFLGDYVSFQPEKCPLLLFISLLKTSVLLMDEHLPVLYLELLEVCREITELMIVLPWNLLPPPWKLMSFLLQLQSCLPWWSWLPVAIYFCLPLLRYCYWNEGPDRKGFLQSSSSRKTFFELFFNFIDSLILLIL